MNVKKIPLVHLMLLVIILLVALLVNVTLDLEATVKHVKVSSAVIIGYGKICN